MANSGVQGPILVWDDTQGSADFVLTPTGMQQGSSLQTAVVQVFTDSRDPNEGDDPRGWWGDAFPNVAGDVWGSLLWLEDRAKLLPTTPDDIRQRMQDGLQWLIDDGITQQIDITVTQTGETSLSAIVEIFKPSGASTNQRFQFAWNLA